MPIEKYRFTANWSKRGATNWQTSLSHLNATPLVYLEIGVFEGRSACWMLDHVMTHPDSRYIGIDPWADYEGREGAAIELLAIANLASHREKAELIRGDSRWVLRQTRWRPESIDVAYIDGDHRAEAVLTDSVLIWPLIRPGGVLIWDDYGNRGKNRSVRKGVDAFLSCLDERFDRLFERDYQLAVRKRAAE